MQGQRVSVWYKKVAHIGQIPQPLLIDLKATMYQRNGEYHVQSLLNWPCLYGAHNATRFSQHQQQDSENDHR